MGRTSAISTKEKKVTQPSGAATPEEADTRRRRASASSGCSFGDDFAGSTRPRCGQGRGPPVSACKPLCAILLAKASVYPLSSAKANVGRFAGDCDKSFFAVWYPLMEVGDGCL